MGNRWLAVVPILIATAACDDGVVIDVVVPDGMTADRVELFIGLDPCDLDVDQNGDGTPDGCDRMKTFSLGPLDGDIFFLDQIVSQPATGPGTYSFRLQRGDRDVVPAMIAVAIDDAEELPDRAGFVPHGSAVIASIDLSGGALRVRAELSSSDQADLWHATDPATRCAAAQRLDGREVFVVDRVDPDCDGFVGMTSAMPECNPLFYRGGVPSSNELVCATVRTNSPTPACLLGTSACVDGVGPDQCGATNICVEDSVCTKCPGATGIETCFNTNFRDPQTATYLSCALRVADSDLNPCPGMNAEATVDLGTLIPSSLGCSEILFAPVDDPRSLDVTHYTDKLEVQTDIQNTQLATSLQLALTQEDNNCQFQLAWQAPLAVNGTSGESFASTMLIKIDNSIANRKLLLPVLVTLEGCNDTTPSNCTLRPVNTTAVTNCIR